MSQQVKVEVEVEVEVQDEKKEKTKAKKKLPPIALKSTTYDEPPSLRWMYAIRKMVKEASSDTLKKESVIHAMNHMIQVLRNHANHVRTSWFHYSSAYDRFAYGGGILVARPLTIENAKSFCQIRMNSVRPVTTMVRGKEEIRWHYNDYPSAIREETKEEKEAAESMMAEINDAFEAVFQEIKDDVLPYIQRKQQDLREKAFISEMEAIEKRMSHQRSKHQMAMFSYKVLMEKEEVRFQKVVEQYHKDVMEASQKLQGNRMESRSFRF